MSSVEQRPQHRRFYILATLFSVGGILLLLSRVNPDAVIEAMQQVNIGFFALSTLIAVGIQVIVALRWRVLLSYRLPLWHSVTASFVGLAVNAVTPLRLGEVVRAGLARRSAQLPMSETIPSIILGQLLDWLTLLLLGLLLIMTVPLSPQLVNTMVIVGGATIVSLAILYIITHISGTQRQQAKGILSRYFNDRVVQFIRRVLAHIRNGLESLNNRGQLLNAIGLSLLFWSILALANWLLLPTLIPAPSIWMGVSLSFATGLGRVAPALPGDIGTLDLAVMLNLIALGVPEDIAITVALLIRIRYIIMIIVVGLIGISGERLSITNIRQLAHEQQNP